MRPGVRPAFTGPEPKRHTTTQPRGVPLHLDHLSNRQGEDMNDPGDPMPGQFSGITTYRAVHEYGLHPYDISAGDVEALLAEHQHAADKHGYDHLLTNPALSEIDKLSALMEEVGEVAQLLTYDKRPHGDPGVTDAEIIAWERNLAKELLQVANLALAWRHSVAGGGN